MLDSGWDTDWIQLPELAWRVLVSKLPGLQVHAPTASRLRENYFGTAELRWPVRLGYEAHPPAGCSKRPSGKAAASEEARRTLRYVEPLSAARTPLADFFSILLALIVTIMQADAEFQAISTRSGGLR